MEIRYRVALDGEQWQVGRKRSTNRALTFYITAASFKSGDGMRIGKFSYSPDATKACSFAKFTAEAIAKQLTTGYKRYINVRVEPVNTSEIL